LELKTDSSAKDIFDEKSLTEFWPLMINSYPKVTEKALRALIPFVSTYLCESGFSTLLQIKSKQRNRLDVENDMRCALSKISPRIMDLVRKKQSQISH
jgi:zinc finger BED domain-containing protein 5/7/8/9